MKKFDIKKFLKENKIYLGKYKTVKEDTVFKGINDRRRNSHTVNITKDGKLDLYTRKEITINEKWEGDVKVKSTGEHAGKTVQQLKSELDTLKNKSKGYQDKGQKVPQSIIDQEREILFAIRAKKGWPKGKGSTLD